MRKSDDVLYRPWKDLEELQNKKLRYFLTRILYPFSPFYREVFDKNKIKPADIKTAEDLKRIPFSSKKDFLDLIAQSPVKASLQFCLAPNEELIKKYLPKTDLIKYLLLDIFKGKGYVKALMERQYKPIFLTATTGTTNAPITFLYTGYDIDNLHTNGRRLINIFGMKGSEKALNVFPYAPHLAFWQTVFAGVSGNIFMLSTGGGKTLGTEGNIRALAKIAPQYLIGVPGYVYHMLKTAAGQGLNLSFLNNIILGAGSLPKGFKQKISALLEDMGAANVKVFGTYGFTEARCAWAECPTNIDVSSGYHTYPDMEVFEVIDPDTGEVKKEGEDGELVYTSIDARGSCVLRYRTGDLVKGGIIYSPCPHCGRRAPRISSEITRASNIKNFQLSKIKGSLVNLNNIELMLEDKAEIDEWQIEISKKDNDPYELDELALYVSLRKDVDKELFQASLNEELLSSEEISFNRVYFVSQEEIKQRIDIEQSVKAKRIIDKRPSW